MKKIFTFMSLLILCGSASAQQQRFMPEPAVQDNIRSTVPRIVVKPVITSPEVLFPGDYNKQADYLMNLVSSYYRLSDKGPRVAPWLAIYSIKGLGILSTGKTPVVTDQTLMFWIPREIINAMYYSDSEDVRGFAAVTLGMVAQGKSDAYNKEIISSLYKTVRNTDCKYDLRRAAVIGLGSISTPAAVSAMSNLLQEFSKSHDFIGRDKVRDEDDNSTWGLEATIVHALGSKLEAGNPVAAQAEKVLRYYGAVSGKYCGDRTYITYPKYTDKTILIAARMELAKANKLYSSFGKVKMADGTVVSRQLGTVTCLLPIANEGALPCYVVKGASKEFWRINGDMIYRPGSYLPGGGDCTQHILNTLVYEYAKAYVMGAGIGLIVKGLSIAAYTGIETIAGMRGVARLKLYSKIVGNAMKGPKQVLSTVNKIKAPYSHYKKLEKAMK